MYTLIYWRGIIFIGISILCFLVFSYFIHKTSRFEEKDAIQVTADHAKVGEKTERGRVLDRRGVVLTTELSRELDDVHGKPVDERGLSQIIRSIQSSSTIHDDETILSLDSELQTYTYKALEKIAQKYKYQGGAGIIMDVETGEVLSLASYSEVTIEGETQLNRVTEGLYVPGSVIKPFVAMGVLNEQIIDPTKKILSTGSIQIPDSLKDGKFSVFHDWKAHGYVDMREAIGVSSNVYFYTVGGGFGDQEGLGIERLEKYLRMFGLGSMTGIDVLTESEGVIPNPAWKAKKYNGDAWRIGDMYLASIGQHGYQITPVQLVRATVAIANKGTLLTPTLFLDKSVERGKSIIPIPEKYFDIVQEGMQYAVMHGTASGLYMSRFPISAKTGTAEVGGEKQFINSWIIGYFPSNKPKYAFTIMLEQGPWGEEIGAVSVAHDVLQWIREHRPEYTGM